MYEEDRWSLCEPGPPPKEDDAANDIVAID